MTGAFQWDGVVVWERLLPASPFAISERHVLGGPHDECGAMIAQLGQPLLDGREEGPACQDLSGEIAVSQREAGVGNGPR
jgi:hypothetical protein